MYSKERMIQEQLRDRDIYDERVLEDMRAVEREVFVPDEIKDMAYDDTPLPIGIDQTISQPYIVAYMAQSLDLHMEDKVLEVGSGCGYNHVICGCSGHNFGEHDLIHVRFVPMTGKQSQ